MEKKEGAFAQVVQPIAFAYPPSSSTQPKWRRAVFINHRGLDVKRTFADSIRYILSLKGVQAFVDERDLKDGDPFPKEIQEAMDNASLHIAIFSKRYAESQWCLAELSHMLKTGVTIIPIFYQVKSFDLRQVDNGIYADAFAQHDKKGRYTAETLRDWKDALRTVSYRKGYELKDDDWGVFEGLTNCVMAEISRPSQGEYPDAVGLDEARDHVIGLVDLEDKLTRKIVVVYGVGGIGKTTLATAVFNTLKLTDYKYCSVVMQEECSESDIKSLQEQIFKDLFNRKKEFRNWREGRDLLSDSFRNESTRPFFMFIDNALKGSDLAMLLPEDLSCLPLQSRVLITTRKLDETDIVLHPHHIQRFDYVVERLPDLQAKNLLCKKVLGSVHVSFETEIEIAIDDLVKRCGGIPLVVKLSGSKLVSERSRLSQGVSHWVNFLKETLQEGEGDLSEKVVDRVYNTLEDSCKEAFLDVASFFDGLKRDYVAKIVGDVQMKGLEDAALVKISGDKVTMHDIVRARGKWLSKSNRITDIESLKAVFRDPQKLQQLKGIMIHYPYLRENIEIQSDDLDLTSQTLRTLQVNGSVKFKGQCKRRFESLRFLRVNWRVECLSIGPNNLKRLVVCHGDSLSVNNYDCQIAKSLRVLKLDFSSTLPERLGDLSSLEKLELWNCDFVSLPDSLGKLSRLRSLRIIDADRLVTLPESIGQLKSLEVLYLIRCPELEGLPKSVSQLSSLQRLTMFELSRMSRLPDKFGELQSLKYLDIESCGLRNLSEDFGRLTSLAAMNVSKCFDLEEKEVDSLLELKELMLLNICGSIRLEARWEQKRLYHPLVVHSASDDGFLEYHCWRQFKKMMSWEVLHSAGARSMQLDDGGNRLEWKPSSSFVGGQAKVGVLFTMCDLCAPSNSEGLQTVRDKCTELLRQGFHIIYVEVVGLGELSKQSEDHIQQALLRLPPGTIAWIFPQNNMSQLFAYSAYKYLIQPSPFYIQKPRFYLKKDFCNSDGVEQVTLALDALNTFLVEVKPRDSQQSEHAVDESERFRRLFSPLDHLDKAWYRWFKW